MKIGKMTREVLRNFFKKPATVLYPVEKLDMPLNFRGKLLFHPEKCIGCKLCMRDCPTNAIEIRPVGPVADKQFECEIDLSRCIYCAQCVDSCMKKALEATRDVELAQLDKKSLKIIYGPTPGNNPKK
ncbi:MAG: 4Fe-4S binding protein [Candidatus Omnitrophota bacterium]